MYPMGMHALILKGGTFAISAVMFGVGFLFIPVSFLAVLPMALF